MLLLCLTVGSELLVCRYARLGLPRVSLPADLPMDHAKLDALLRQEGRVVVYFSLALLLAPVVESLVLLDRMLFLQERGDQPGGRRTEGFSF